MIRYIDLFAGLGGIRIGFQNALDNLGVEGECVFSSEIKPHAISVYKENFDNENIAGDITKINESDIPDFDVLLAGFPCQPFSSAGARRGFMDTRGTLFFDIERILKAKKPKAFLLENVEGLVVHDRVNKGDSMGRTMKTILDRLKGLGYVVSWRILDASEYGVPQRRKRVYIVGCLDCACVDLDNLPKKQSSLSDIMIDSVNIPDELYLNSELANKLQSKFTTKQLAGKQIKDKRGGENNIHSWDVELYGPVSSEQRCLMELILKKRRQRVWASKKHIKWSDGMPLTLDDIASFYLLPVEDGNGQYDDNLQKLRTLLDDLVNKGYLKYETPKQAPDREDLRGYNIVAGKLSFDISNILDPDGKTPTLVAMYVTKMAVPDRRGLRRLAIREGLRLFGFPETYSMRSVGYKEAYDLLGNSVCVNVISLVSERLVSAIVQ